MASLVHHHQMRPTGNRSGVLRWCFSNHPTLNLNSMRKRNELDEMFEKMGAIANEFGYNLAKAEVNSRPEQGLGNQCVKLVSSTRPNRPHFELLEGIFDL